MMIRKADDVAAKPVEAPGASGCRIQWLIAQEQAAPTFYMRRFTIAPAGHTPKHTHPWEHEVYILQGSGQVFTPQGLRPMEADDVIYVPPDEEHQFINSGDGPLKLLCVIPTTGK